MRKHPLRLAIVTGLSLAFCGAVASAQTSGEAASATTPDAAEAQTDVGGTDLAGSSVGDSAETVETGDGAVPPVGGDTPEEAATEAPPKPIGLIAGLGVYTSFNFRGYNLFQQESQHDQNAIVAPSLVWLIFDTGTYLGYWGGYQLTGNNQADVVRAGVGNAQLVFLGYNLGLLDRLITLNFQFNCYFWPFADEDLAGSSAPTVIEPLAGITLSTVLDIGFNVSYFHGVQPGTLFETLRHVYFQLFAKKSLTFNDRFGMDFGLSFGAKAWIDHPDFNRFDLLFSWSLPINLTERLFLKPGINLSWTDLDQIVDSDDPTITREATGGDEYMVYGTIDIGARF